MKSRISVCMAGAVLMASSAAWPSSAERDVMAPLPPGAVRLLGGLEEPILRSVEHWHKGKVPYHEFAEFFRKGSPQFAIGEMWGKFVRSGAMQYRHLRDPGLKAVLDAAVADILSVQRPNGSVSCVPDEQQPGGDGHTRPLCSDLWERKYVMLGLEDYYEWVERRPDVLASLRRQADCIVRQVGPAPKRDIREIGWSPNCIESSSILEPFMRLYKLTGCRDYLDFARYVVESGGAKGSDLFAQARAGTPPWRMGEPYPKAYEMTSVFEGLAEWHRVTGDASAKEAVLKYFDSVLRNEITIVGNGGGDYPHWQRWLGEAWDNTAVEQSNPDMTRMMETCVGVTWMKYASQVLRLTGDARAADAIELYVYNGLLGAMRPGGDGFSYVNLLNGEKVTNSGWGWTFSNGPVTCCNLNGPMGLAYIPFVAVMQAKDGPVVNLYNAGTAVARTASGGEVRLAADGDLLDASGWRMTVAPAREEEFAVSLRIPGWSERTSVKVNGEPVSPVPPGRYLKISRMWRSGDRVSVAFDFKARRLAARRGRNFRGDKFQAVTWGPIALSRDENADPDYAAPVTIKADADGLVAVRRIAPLLPTHRLEFRVPTRNGFITMCDYASVDGWKGKRVQTWLPVEKTPARRAPDAAASADTAGVKKALRPYVERGEIPGYVSVLVDGDREEWVADGWSDVAKGVPLSKDSLFRICSQTKGIVGAAAAKLVVEGRLSLDDRVSKYLPEFAALERLAETNGVKALVPVKNALTVRDCLSHTGGFPFETKVSSALGWTGAPLRVAAAAGAATPLLFEPGTSWKYSNAGLDVAGAVLEAVTGERIEDHLERVFFGPLGMKDTTFRPTAEQIGRLVSMYYVVTNETCRQMPKYRPLPEPYDSPDRWPSCGAGLFSTPRDLLEFYRMLAFGGVSRDGRRVMPEEAVGLLAAKQTPPGVKTAYSLGMFVEGEWFGHDGALKTAALLNPKRHAVWLWMMQCEYPGRINRWHQYRVWKPVVNRFFEQSTGKGSNGETP